ncbi:hypothetical protein ASC97_18960 [Rhizobium sp. Root1203]|uniref:DUF983 domain-containing protein n=1 Tax=Rhizobium sp. Root1203 TaxID=1736427 RepID=UPI00070A5A4E|nr:DUF983 domain-containing protein [Rhizobium sp. Root1203]KQV31765.1 hypothetical protein ASC97_18960 [Rhizobium sp. Root1203]
MTTTSGDQAIRFGDIEEVKRPLWQSIKRGLLCRCPACGSGRLFRSFLKPVDNCAACGEAMHHHRSDDLPPYLTIVVIGHVIIAGYMMTDMVWPMPLWLTFTIWTPITLLATLMVIQPIKGGVIALQWAMKMHGFGGHNGDDEYEIPGRRR